VLIQAAGSLATFSPDVEPWKFPVLAHTDLRGTFEELFARVTALLRATVVEGYMNVPLEINQSVHVGKLEDERLLSAGNYLLSVRTEIPEHQLIQRLPGLCKIASSTQLPAVLRSAATPGVPIQHTNKPPPEVPVRAGVVYFALNLQNDYWRAILQERKVAIYLPPPFDPTHVKLELLAVPRAA
jgi:type VI secretion system protein ImpJ